MFYGSGENIAMKYDNSLLPMSSLYSSRVRLGGGGGACFNVIIIQLETWEYCQTIFMFLAPIILIQILRQSSVSPILDYISR